MLWEEKLTSMNAEDLVIDDHAQREEIEHVRKVMPHIRITVFPRTLCIKPI
jgi:hypothetical protein